jgi:hypothetical protein
MNEENLWVITLSTVDFVYLLVGNVFLLKICLSSVTKLLLAPRLLVNFNLKNLINVALFIKKSR